MGCGRGTWLKAALELGATKAVGLDGSWNSSEKMVDPRVEFQPTELNHSIELQDRFDLAISLEVAEHLDPKVSDVIVGSLCSMSDLVLFGAACPHQGGKNHINEQWASNWAARFIQHDFLVFDIYRPQFWLDASIPFWYRQNSFVYAKSGSRIAQVLLSKGHCPLSSLAFMDCVHPELLELKVCPPSFMSALDMASQGVTSAIGNFVPAVSRALRR